MSTTLPSWTCFIDGYALISNNISQANLLNNNVEVCSLQNIVTKATPSNLTVVASGNTTSDPLAPFLFDYIQYEPDATVILDNATIVVDAFDGQIGYSSGWTTPGEYDCETSVQNSSLNFDFVGAFRL